MKNKDKFRKFYGAVNNPLTEENLRTFANEWQKTNDNKALYDKITENNYPNFSCSNGLVNKDFLILTNKNDKYYFGEDKFYQNLDDYKKDVKHQLYIGAGYEMQDRIVNNFINLCHNNEIPFFIKVSSEKKNDNIIFFATDSNFFDYLEILKHMSVDLINYNELLKKNYMPEIAGLFEPPFLTTKYCNWIGYGSKPNDQDNYLESRINFLEQAISKIIEKDTRVTKQTLEYLRKCIIKEGQNNNIDPNNFAFNDDMANEIKVLRK